METEQRLVWFPDERHGYAIGRIVDIGQTEVAVKSEAEPLFDSWKYREISQLTQQSHHQANKSEQQNNAKFKFPYKSVFPLEQRHLDALLGRHNNNNIISQQFAKLKVGTQNGLSNATQTNQKFAPQDLIDLDDNCALVNLNEAALLDNIRLRFFRNKIYTYVAHILVAVNPYVAIPNLHSPEAILRYQGKSLGTMAPHVFAIADKAYRDMKALKQSQSIIINGESGGGKTESQKYVLRYLCLSGSQSGRLEELILDANPLLEAFGNAKTIRNNNSSRFGKFIQIHYSNKLQVTGGLVFHYLLEKSRICTQSAGERNYHIFYQLCGFLPRPIWKKLHLAAPDHFHYLRQGCTQYFRSGETSTEHSGECKIEQDRESEAQRQLGPLRDQLTDDFRCYKQTDRALSSFGLSEQDKMDLFSVVAAVLHLGNINFTEESSGESVGGGRQSKAEVGCRVEPSAEAEQALRAASELLGLEVELLRESLVTRVMSTGRSGHKGTVYMVQLSVGQAQAARDALAKAIYARLFDHLVGNIINRSILMATGSQQVGPMGAGSGPAIPPSSSLYIGVLDVAGFEYFEHNGFEQLLINYCNEKLQQFFNERILNEEQLIYQTEGLGLQQVEFIDNQDCLDLFERRSAGLFDLLDEESRLPRPSASHFTSSLHSSHQRHSRLGLPRQSRASRWHREIRDDEGFVVRHFAGAVCYESGSFIEKNNDALHHSLRQLMLEASNKLVGSLFRAGSSSTSNANSPIGSGPAVSFSSNYGAGSVGTNKLNFVSVASNFRSQLNQLMEKLRSTGSHFIRCIKPNSEMVPGKFEGGQILAQLRCSGMDSVLELMHQGFPSRASFNDLYAGYQAHLPPQLARLDPHLFCRALFKALGLGEADFRFGASKVFFKPGAFAQFDQIVRAHQDHPEQLEKLIEKARTWLLAARWRRWQYAALAAIRLASNIHFRRQKVLLVQRHWRRTIVHRHLGFRLAGWRQVRALETSLGGLAEVLGGRSLRNSPEDARLLQSELDALREDLTSFRLALITDIQLTVGGKMQSQQQRNKSQSGGQKQVAEKLEQLVTKRDLLIRSVRSKQEELVGLERQMEVDRKQRQLDEERRLRDQLAKEQRQKLEHRRQQELVQQVTHSDTSGLNQRPNTAATTSQPVAPSENFAASNELDSRFDLSGWKYSDLRDTINTSCDLELLEACKREFHRRLKVYHAWRASNSPALNQQPEEFPNTPTRAPHSVLADAALSVAGSQATDRLSSSEQRYFRIPFVKGSSGKGWWFAHFEGQWIARQLELHPGREPILLVAGRHDIEMCELSLAETRLTSKRGAEILPHEFELVWAKHGGQPYVRRKPTS